MPTLRLLLALLVLTLAGCTSSPPQGQPFAPSETSVPFDQAWEGLTNAHLCVRDTPNSCIGQHTLSDSSHRELPVPLQARTATLKLEWDATDVRAQSLQVNALREDGVPLEIQGTTPLVLDIPDLAALGAGPLVIVVRVAQPWDDAALVHEEQPYQATLTFA